MRPFRLPKYRRHTLRNFAFVEISGKRVRLPGAFNSAESRAAYHRFLAELEAAADDSDESTLPRAIRPTPAGGTLTVAHLAGSYLDDVASRKGTASRGEYATARNAMRFLVHRHGGLLIEEFGPLRLREIQSAMIADDQSRSYINGVVNRIRAAFKWGVAEEIVPTTIHAALTSVRGVRRGDAREAGKRTAVAWSEVERTLPQLSPVIAAMVQTQWHTGVRSQSICQATAEQFVFDEKLELLLWRIRHKTEGRLADRGETLVIPIGPTCEAVLVPFRHGKQGAAAIFPPSAGGSRSRLHRDFYDADTYRRAVQRGCDRAGVPRWAPHQIRHARGHLVRERFGVEAAQAVLGHESLAATQIYSERRFKLACEIARELG